MKKDIKQFLESSLLEEYVLGTIDPARIAEVEEYINTSGEVKAAYEDLQINIELLAKKLATAPPANTKANILREIDQSIAASQAAPKHFNWWAMAAGITALVCGIWAFSLSRKNATLQTKVGDLQEQYNSLQDQCEQKQLQYAQQETQWKMLADAQTEKYILTGNDKAPELETVAYWNKESQTSYIRMLRLPALPANKCLQLWADVDGEMLNLNVLPETTGQLVAIPFKVAATSLNITIEPEGGSLHPTVADLVASVAI